MDETRDVTTERPRKPYAKPQIQEVPLRPVEAVLGGCKTASTGGPGGSDPKCTKPAPCSSMTS